MVLVLVAADFTQQWLDARNVFDGNCCPKFDVGVFARSRVSLRINWERPRDRAGGGVVMRSVLAWMALVTQPALFVLWL